MKIDLMISAEHIKKDKLLDKSVVVIDMLRATSVITTALNNGCEKVIPLLTIEKALDLVRENREKHILGGERKALKIEGFDCANSPLEYTSELVKNKTVVMTTTNGTRAIKGSEGARNIFIGALLNAKAVAKKLVEINNDVVFVNAGTYGELSIDDFICSGYIIDCIFQEIKAMGEIEPQLTDVAVISRYTYNNNEDILSFIKYASHYKRIMELGLEDDLAYCCRKDSIKIVPEYKEGCIK